MRSLLLRRETLGTRLLLIVIGSRISGNPQLLGGKKHRICAYGSTFKHIS